METYYSKKDLIKAKNDDTNYVYDLTDLKEFLKHVPTADVVPREEAERWKNAMMGECMLSCCILRDEFMREAETAVAKKIFKEIEKFIRRYCNETHYGIGDMVYDIKDLEEKYTKGGEER